MAISTTEMTLNVDVSSVHTSDLSSDNSDDDDRNVDDQVDNAPPPPRDFTDQLDM